MAGAAAVDARIAAGEDPGPLAGVPYAAKNLFDLTGIPTLAGSRIRRDAPPRHPRMPSWCGGWMRPGRSASAR